MKTLFFHCCFIILFVLVVGSQAAAQVKPLMENDQIKIYEATIKVGVKHWSTAIRPTRQPMSSAVAKERLRFPMELPRLMITRPER
jgi:hypothetical protein